MRSYIAMVTLLLAASCGSVTAIGHDGGQGGSPGTGGATATGGTPGSGGSGGSAGGPSCAQIQTAYAAAVASARACSVDGTNQCQKMVASALGCNGCPTFVNDDAGLSQYDNEWNQAGCDQNQVCTNIACLAPRAATCKASDAGGATCVDSFVATPAN
jgi:hypothetical protein